MYLSIFLSLQVIAYSELILYIRFLEKKLVAFQQALDLSHLCTCARVQIDAYVFKYALLSFTPLDEFWSWGLYSYFFSIFKLVNI